jgi:hypothetical protein
MRHSPQSRRSGAAEARGDEAVRRVDFFSNLYDNPKPFLDSFSLYYSLPQLPLTVLILWRGDTVSPKLRLFVATGGFIASLVLLAVLGPLGPGWAYGAIALLGASMALYQPTIFGIASLFPPAYNATASTGQGLAAIIASLARITTKLILPDGDDVRSSDTFFGLAVFVLLLAVGAMVYLDRVPFARQFLEPRTSSGSLGGPGGGGGADPFYRDPSSFLGPSFDFDDDGLQKHSLLHDSSDGSGRGAGAGDRGGRQSNACRGLARVPYVLRAAYLPLLCVFGCFFITFAAYPGEVDEIPYHGMFGAKDFLGANEWWAIVLLLVFAIFDTVGRSVSPLINTSLLLTAALIAARAVLVPLLALLADSTPQHTNGFYNDAAAIIVVAIFSFTNGFLCSRALILGPALLPAEDQEFFGFLVSLSIQLGILFGSLVSIGIGAIRART